MNRLSPTESQTAEYNALEITQSVRKKGKIRRDPVLVLRPETPDADSERPIFDSAPVYLGKTPPLTSRTNPLLCLNLARVELLLDGRLRVTDLGSIQGTFVNSVQVSQAYAKCGDKLKVGDITYYVTSPERETVDSSLARISKCIAPFGKRFLSRFRRHLNPTPSCESQSLR